MDSKKPSFDPAYVNSGAPPKGTARRNGFTQQTWRCCKCRQINKIGKPEWADRCQRPNSSCADIRGDNHKRCERCFPMMFGAWDDGAPTTRWNDEDGPVKPDHLMDIEDQMNKGYKVFRSFGGLPKKHDQTPQPLGDVGSPFAPFGIERDEQLPSVLSAGNETKWFLQEDTRRSWLLKWLNEASVKEKADGSDEGYDSDWENLSKRDSGREPRESSRSIAEKNRSRRPRSSSGVANRRSFKASRPSGS